MVDMEEIMRKTKYICLFLVFRGRNYNIRKREENAFKIWPVTIFWKIIKKYVIHKEALSILIWGNLQTDRFKSLVM